MTGGQDVTGLMDVPALTRALAAEGVRRIVVCAEDPRHYGRHAQWADGVDVVGRERLPAAQEELRGVAGVTVIVYDQRCAAEARRLRKLGLLEEPPQRVVINEAVCEGCGDCSTKSNCLSVLPVDTEFGEKRRIHDSSCNRDYTCLEGDCPSFVTITPRAGERRASRRVAARVRPSLPAGALPDPPVAAIDGQYAIYFTGIGGTGVVTANRILATAAEAAGFSVDGLDQTGLSQKAGAVVSHLHLAEASQVRGAAAVGDGCADLYLSGDILQAASATHLAKVNPGRTIAVVDRDLTPTATMLQTDLVATDVVALEQAIEARVGSGAVTFVASRRIAEEVLGDHLLANVVVLGAAFQLGGLPMSLDEVERGIARQGRTAAQNRNAFAWGRWSVHDPSAVEAKLAEARGSGGVFEPSAKARRTAADLVAARAIPDVLRVRVTRRAAQVVDYQDAARAARYLDLVARAARHDGAEHGWALTEAVAEAWFKLLTYKDEYEVARLHLQADYERTARQLGIDGEYSVTYHLHPPVLRRVGLSRKLPLGRPYELAFRALRGMRRVRGTRFDLFGWDPDRRTERWLIDEYERLLDASFEHVPAPPNDVLVELAASPMAIKGYGPVKERSVAAWRDTVVELQRRASVAAAAPTA
jgi:indolepyruvate ferredoxin oxidoreductase